MMLLGTNPRLRRRRGGRPLVALVAACASAAALAQGDPGANDTPLREVVVTATRTEAEAQKVPATITRATREDIDGRLPADDAELFKNEPDVAFGRDARVWNLTTGTFSKSLAGDTFPLRDFAPGTTDTVGVFVQDEIAGLAGGRLTLVPGLRYDWRRLEPQVDVLSQAVLAAIGRQAVAQTDGAVSPKLAASWQFMPALSAYGQIVRGFRAPNYEEVNGHFRNAAQSYGITPNPNLQPEASTGVELGLRYGGPALRAQLAAFDNRYKNFITTVQLVCPGDPNCIAGLGTTFMPVNRSRVRIYGVEARFAWDVARGWRVWGAVAHARGGDEASGRPLDSVEPTRWLLALAREYQRWGAEATLRAAAAVKRVDDFSGPTFAPWFRPPGYEVLDLAAWFTPSPRLRLALAVNNLFDRKYWQWSDIRLADARNPAGVDLYSRPGRNVAARVEYAF